MLAPARSQISWTVAAWNPVLAKTSPAASSNFVRVPIQIRILNDDLAQRKHPTRGPVQLLYWIATVATLLALGPEITRTGAAFRALTSGTMQLIWSNPGMPGTRPAYVTGQS